MTGRATYHSDGRVTYTIDSRIVTKEEYDRWLLPAEDGFIRTGELPDDFDIRDDLSQTAPDGGFMCSAPGIWPLKSEALAVHPDQIAEARDSAICKGVRTEFDQSGRPIFNDRNHRRNYMKAYGYHDKDGGYGDAQPANKRKRIIPKPVEQDPEERR